MSVPVKFFGLASRQIILRAIPRPPALQLQAVTVWRRGGPLGANMS